MHSHRLLIALLALICAAFATVVATELTSSAGSASQTVASDASAPSKPEFGAAQRATFSLPGLPSFSIVTERPVFSPSRRPAARAADGSGAWSSFELAGIIITPQAREALIVHGKPPAIVHIAEGQAVEGWTLKAIYRDHVVFSDHSDEHELKLIDRTSQLPLSGRPLPPRQPNP